VDGQGSGMTDEPPSSAKSIQLLVLTNHNTSDGIYWHMLNHTQRTLLLIKMSQPSDLVEEKMNNIVLSTVNNVASPALGID